MRDMATGCMYRKVGIGMGGYVLYYLGTLRCPGMDRAWAWAWGSERVRVRDKEGRGREGPGSRLQTGLAIRNGCNCVRVHKARQNPDVRNEQ